MKKIPRYWVAFLFAGIVTHLGAAWGTDSLVSTSQKKSNRWSTRVLDGESLGQISMRLYGTTKKWKKIAEWNQLSPPYRIKVNQLLVLEVQPALSEQAGNDALLQMWRKRFGLVEQAPLVAVPATPVLPQVPQKVQALVEEAKKEDRTLEVKEQIQSIQDTSKMDEEQIKQVETQVEKLEEEEYQAKGFYELGQKHMQSKQYEKAFQSFRKSRTLDPDLLAPWFYEIKALRLMSRDDEAKEVVVELLDHRPELKELPVLQGAPQGGGSKN